MTAHAVRAAVRLVAGVVAVSVAFSLPYVLVGVLGLGDVAQTI